MFKKTVFFTLVALILLSNPIQADQGETTYADLVGLYPEIVFEDLENYEYTIEEHGKDFYLIKVSGTWYLVKL